MNPTLLELVLECLSKRAYERVRKRHHALRRMTLTKAQERALEAVVPREVARVALPVLTEAPRHIMAGEAITAATWAVQGLVSRLRRCAVRELLNPVDREG